MVALISITILTLICATALYVTSQNANSTTQTSSWQQALGGAESGVDRAIAALNTTTWTGWTTFNGSVPNTQPVASPTPAPNASGPPASGTYNYSSATISPQTSAYSISNSITTAGEGSPNVSVWTTIDTGGMGTDGNGNQWYRVRSTGTAFAPGPGRVSNQRADSDLRKIGLRFDRKTNATISSPVASRTIEVVVQALASGGWGKAVLMKAGVQMSGSGTVDSFNSSDPFKSSTISGVAGQYDVTKRQNHGDVSVVSNTTNSDLRNTYLYGNLNYSGPPAIKNTTNVQGTVSTPGPSPPPSTSDPSWAGGSYTAYAGGGSPPVTLPAKTFTASGNKQNPTLIKVNGDFTVPGGNTFTIAASGGNRYITIWVTGKFTTSGSGVITQSANANVTWIVDNDITVSGDSYNNQLGLASNTSFVGVGTGHKVTDSGSANFIGTINAPGSDVTISGSGSFMGAVIGNTLTISGSASLHYDEALNSGTSSSALGNYVFASWFEDTR